MGASASTLIDDLHTSAQMADELAADRKVKALKSVQELDAKRGTATLLMRVRTVSVGSQRGGASPSRMHATYSPSPEVAKRAAYDTMFSVELMSSALSERCTGVVAVRWRCGR